MLTCLDGKGVPEKTRLSLVAEAETAFAHISETDQQTQNTPRPNKTRPPEHDTTILIIIPLLLVGKSSLLEQ